MIIKELRSYDTPKIKSMIVQLKASLLEYRFKASQGENISTSDIKKSRRVIAQLMTILRERNEKLVFSDWKNYGDLLSKKEKEEQEQDK